MWTERSPLEVSILVNQVLSYINWVLTLCVGVTSPKRSTSRNRQSQKRQLNARTRRINAAECLKDRFRQRYHFHRDISFLVSEVLAPVWSLFDYTNWDSSFRVHLAKFAVPAMRPTKDRAEESATRSLNRGSIIWEESLPLRLPRPNIFVFPTLKCSQVGHGIFVINARLFNAREQFFSRRNFPLFPWEFFFYREEDDYFRDPRRRARHFNPKIRRINTRRLFAYARKFIPRLHSSCTLIDCAQPRNSRVRASVGGRPASRVEASTPI